jgi:hypothetical protein
MVAKLEGPFHWHKHDDMDDFFWCSRAHSTSNSGAAHTRSRRSVRSTESVEHRPVARGEVHILLIAPTGTPNTGDKATAAPRILI